MLGEKDKAESGVTKEERSYCIKVIEGEAGIEAVLDATSFQKGIEDGIIIGDLWGYISDVNEVIVKMFGAADKNEFVGKHVLDFLVKEERAQAVQDSLNLIVGDQGETKEYRALSKSGEEIRLEVTIDFIRDKQGEKIGFVDIVRVLPGYKKNQELEKK